jgi:hypothetical protein
MGYFSRRNDVAIVAYGSQYSRGTFMTPTICLRAASIISFVFAAGHIAGGLKKWSPMGTNSVLQSMTTVRFETMGVSRSYLDFFMGFGWSIGVAMLLQAVLLWQLGSLVTNNGILFRPMIAAFALASLATGIIAWRFIFPVPALFSGGLFIALALAYISA